MITIDAKPDFNSCVCLATKLLARQSFDTTKIDVLKFKYDKNIIFDTIQNYSRSTNTPLSDYINNKNQMLSEGCCIPLPEYELYIILYNDKVQSREHLNWTLAHEVGHIYCGHRYDTEIQEIEAHFFAAQLLMPEYVIYKMSKLGIVSKNDICKLFNVSMLAAEKRMKTYSKKHYINKTYDDEKIWLMMKEHIRDYYQHDNLSDNIKRFISIPMIDV